MKVYEITVKCSREIEAENPEDALNKLYDMKFDYDDVYEINIVNTDEATADDMYERMRERDG